MAFISHYSVTMKNMRNGSLLRIVDVIVLLVTPALATIVSLKFSVDFLTSTLLFFGLPAVWLSIRSPQKVPRALVFSLVFIIPLSLFADYLATVSGAWFVPNTVFPFRILEVIPMEDIIWGLFFAYTPIIFYEHFLDSGSHAVLARSRLWHLLWMWLVILSLFLAILSISPGLLYVPYAYVVIGTAFLLLPLIAIVISMPQLIRKFLIVTAYFFPLALLFEITGLQLRQWEFPGRNYIGWVEFASYRIPIEEFFFWFVIGAAAVTGYYEYFADDGK